MTSPFNKSNTFDLSHEHLLTCNMGWLIPNLLMEVVPGDTVRVQTQNFARLEALLAPAMHRIDLYQHYFYVPKRILFDKWEQFITGGPDGNDDTVAPYMVAPTGGYEVGSLQDYLGLPVGVSGYKHSALPIRAYQKIFNEWYRDENLVSEQAISYAEGLDTTTVTTLHRRAWEKDYFTNCLPWPQRGQAASLPFGVSAPVSVYGNGKAVGFTAGSNLPLTGLYASGDNGNRSLFSSNSYGQPVGVNSGVTNPYNAANVGIVTKAQLGDDLSKSGIIGEADLSNASSVTINDMRLAFQVQRFLEKNARGGARLVEWTLSHFGVRIPDSRLQRTEFLGGGRMPIQITPVEQTSSTDSTSPQGNLAGRAVVSQVVPRFTKSFVEQGFIIGIVSVMPRTVYSQGMHRLWSRDSRYKEYLPVFSHLGEQEVLNQEIYTQGTDQDAGIFGYQDRYNEFRHIPSSVHGQFRKGQSLSYWTLAREFDSLPTLSSEFVQANPSKRIFAVTDQDVDSLELESLHNIKAIRPIPKFGNPGLIDHD